MSDEPQINEILLEEFEPKTSSNRHNKKTKKHFIIKFLPRMYWLFYRHPINFLVFLPSLTEGWANMATTICMGNILDAVKKENGLSIVKKNAVYAMLASFVCGILAFFNYFSWIIIGSKIGIKMKRILFKSFMEKDVEFFDTHPIGDLLNLLSADADSVSEAFTELKTHQVSAFGKLLAALFVMYSVNFTLGTFSLISAIVVTLIVQVFKNFAITHFKKVFEFTSQVLTIADETLCNERVVSSFNRQEKQIEMMKESQNLASEHEAKSRMLMHTSFSLGNLINNGTVCLILDFGAYFILKGRITAGGLFSLSKAAFWTGMEIHHLFDTWNQEQRAIDSSNRLYEIIDSPISITEKEYSYIPDRNFQGKIEFKNVWFKYPTRDSWILKNVSFKAEPSEITAMVGHSGSGKSTIVQLLLRFYDVNQGSILIDGINIKEYNQSFLHQNIGVVQQDPYLFSLTISENIRYGKMNATDFEVRSSANIANATKFIEKLPNRFDTMIGGEGGTLLSGGQKQRIAIARAVVKNPRILITDEATSALDSESERKVQTALDKVMDGRTAIVIAHRLGTIREAKNIFVFDQGKLVEHGNHESLIEKHGAYYNLVQRQLVKET